MPPPTTANTNRIRGYNLRQLQGINKSVVNALALNRPGSVRLGAHWRILAGAGRQLASEMTNRLNVNTPENTQIFCDARQWVNKNVNERGSAGFGARRIIAEIKDKDEYSLTVEYNGTQSGVVAASGVGENDQHFFNLMVTTRAGKRAQVAHITIFTTVDPVVPGKPIHRFTPLGFMHLKDDMALHDMHAAAKGQSFRRYFIQIIYIPAVAEVPESPFVPATPTTPERPAVAHVPAVPARIEYRIGLQNQRGNVSTMAINFTRVVIEVLQEYFDANFSTAGFATPAPASLYRTADAECRNAAGINIGGLNDVNDIDEVAVFQAEKAAALTKGNSTSKATAKAFAKVDSDRLALVRTYGIIGGKRKTRRSKKNRRTTRRR